MNYKINRLVKTRENIYFEVNSVLKNTYILLSMTLLFSALISFLSIKFNVRGVNGFVVIITSIVLLLLINFYKNSYLGLPFVFAFTGFLGYTTGPILNYYLSLSNGKELILLSLFSTGIVFFTLSLYVLITKRNFDFLGGFLYVGFFVLLISVIINLFFYIPLLHLVLSGIIVILASSMILYDTSRIVNGGENNYILATISIYLNIYNMFLALLSIFNALFSRD